MSKPVSKTLGIAVAAAACALAPRFAAADMNAHEDFESAATRPVTIALLPARVELTMRRFLNNESQVEEGFELESHLSNALAAEFESRGYEVVSVTAERVNSDPQLQDAIVDADLIFTELYSLLEPGGSRRAWRRYFREDEKVVGVHGIGAAAQVLAARLGVDALAFTRMQLATNSKALRAVSLGRGRTRTNLNVAILDGPTGEVRAFFDLPVLKGRSMGGWEDVMNDPDVEMARYAEWALDGLPDADPSARQVAAESEEDVLADIEALLGE